MVGREGLRAICAALELCDGWLSEDMVVYMALLSFWALGYLVVVVGDLCAGVQVHFLEHSHFVCFVSRGMGWCFGLLSCADRPWVRIVSRGVSRGEIVRVGQYFWMSAARMHLRQSCLRVTNTITTRGPLSRWSIGIEFPDRLALTGLVGECLTSGCL